MTLNQKLIDRREKEKEKKKEKVKEIARKIIRSKGIKALTIRAICDKINYSLPVFYTLYLNKGELLLDILPTIQEVYPTLKDLIINSYD
jgi:AcrR family transcriptional regulator